LRMAVLLTEFDAWRSEQRFYRKIHDNCVYTIIRADTYSNIFPTIILCTCIVVLFIM
jgi:hypothetical protein